MIRRVKRGRIVTIDPKVLLWRKRNKRYLVYKQKIMDLFREKGLSVSQARFFLETPMVELGDKSPKELLCPLYAKRVYLALKSKLQSV